MSLVPMAAIAGVFVAVAFSMIDDWTRNATVVLWRQSLSWRAPLALLQNYGVMLLVAGITVFVSLALAVAIGTLIAMILFIRSNCKAPVRQVANAERTQLAQGASRHGCRPVANERQSHCAGGTRRRPVLRNCRSGRRGDRAAVACVRLHRR